MLYFRKKRYEFPNIQIQKLGGTGHPVLLIHGLNSSSDCWNSVVSHLGHSYSFHLVKIKGFDYLPAPETPSLAAIKNDIENYVITYSLNQPLVIGHSMGGMLALWIASSISTHLGPLVIIDSLPFMGAALNPFLNAFTNYHYAKWLEHKVLSIKSEEDWRNFQLKYLKMMVSNEKSLKLTLHWALGADTRMSASGVHGLFSIDLRHTIRNIDNPTLVLATWRGYESHGFSYSQIHQIFEQQYKLLPNKSIIFADEARHYLMLDDPEFLNNHLDNFIKPYRKRGLFNSKILSGEQSRNKFVSGRN